MAYRLIWHNEAIDAFRRAICYGQEVFGDRVASLFASQILKQADLLVNMPYIGQKEAFTIKLKHEYRSLVVHSRYKLIYFIDDKLLTVHIVDFWPTENDPKRLEKSLV